MKKNVFQAVTVCLETDIGFIGLVLMYARNIALKTPFSGEKTLRPLRTYGSI